MSMTSAKKMTLNLSNYLHQQIPDFHIDQTKHEALCFREKVSIHCKYDRYKKSVGTFSISVERVGPKAQEFLVNIYSSVIIDGYSGESKILSTVNGELQFLEEKRNEHFESSNGMYKQSLYLGIEESCYSIKTVQESPDEKNSDSFDLAYENNYGLLSEGSNILFIRYLALNNFIGDLDLHFITIEGKLITCNYECLGLKNLRINNRNIDAYRIKQTLNNANVCTENMIYLTKRGRILKIDWCDLPYEIKINSLIDPLMVSQDSINIPLPAIWKKDAELISKYLDKKVCEKDKQNNYLLHHLEIKNLVLDYINSLLSGKPKDVLMFTIQYFKNQYDCPIQKESTTTSSKNTLESNNNPDENDFTLHKSAEIRQINCSCNDAANNKSSSSTSSISDIFK